MDENLNNDEALKSITLPKAILMSIETWNSVKTETIINCFADAFQNAFLDYISMANLAKVTEDNNFSAYDETTWNEENFIKCLADESKKIVKK